MKEWTKSDSLTVSMQAFSKNGRIPEIFALEKTTHVVARDLSNCRAFLKMVKLLITVIQNQLPFIAVYGGRKKTNKVTIVKVSCKQ